MECNLANVVFPGRFDPASDKWSEYRERLLFSLDVAGVSNSDLERARSIFLSQCGKETYSLIVSLLVPLRPTEVAFKEILAVLDQFYEPELNEILQAGKFHTRVQMENERVQDFVAAIGVLGTKANFTELKRQLRDRLVLGVRDKRLRRELLKTKKLTYETAVQLCLNHQAIVEDIYPDTKLEKKQTHIDVEPMDIGRISVVECRHCARSHREGERYPLAKAKCFYCKRVGHIAAACRKNNKKQHKVADETEEVSVDKKEDMMGIYTCAESFSPPIKAEIIINGSRVIMEVDSGASRTIISEATFRRLWNKPPPQKPTNVKLTFPTSSTWASSTKSV